MKKTIEIDINEIKNYGWAFDKNGDATSNVDFFVYLMEKGLYIEEIYEALKHNHEKIRLTAAKLGYKLDELCYDKNPYVRIECVKQKYRLSKFVNDESKLVRIAVADQGFGLDKLIEDDAPEVRAAVARQRYKLDVLINDKSKKVLYEVAKQGYGLNILVHNKYPEVRRMVASITKDESHIELLLNDPDTEVKEIIAMRGFKLKELKENLDIPIKTENINDSRIYCAIYSGLNKINSGRQKEYKHGTYIECNI